MIWLWSCFVMMCCAKHAPLVHWRSYHMRMQPSAIWVSSSMRSTWIFSLVGVRLDVFILLQFATNTAIEL